ncbi:hypothetical protein FHX82_005156 [Amycolatopsis bartoniae]|uniref:Uncharacterized protein n=1 Tax=Amycolatopsis bartoniae TaxID=941986 RepID=A0A8H9INV2_9PSEU|nr:hypothetical protein [Amycolatopsis bartoniae]MBB2938080.1 hypothetical protein [Amycolatopsis bartoniae]TVT09914.1 hypothetical protein FNH07_06585 [Amycolatopsis bartoniae]GHF32538.1 hypothetical protein GCM10017566_01380 [Amycolatopsis bartoniae]
MPLTHPGDPERTGREEIGVNPVFTREPVRIPRDRLPEGELDHETAYRVSALGAFKLITDGRQLPVFAFTLGFTHNLADLLLQDLRRALPRLRGQDKPQHGTESSTFSHGAESGHNQDPRARAQAERA